MDQWLGGSDDRWSNPANWSDGVPQDGWDATFDSGVYRERNPGWSPAAGITSNNDLDGDLQLHEITFINLTTAVTLTGNSIPS